MILMVVITIFAFALAIKIYQLAVTHLKHRQQQLLRNEATYH